MVYPLCYLVGALALLVGVYGQSKVTQSDDGSSGTISFSTPDLNDEESHSPWMPDMLKCDACKVVALQLHEKFDAFNNKFKHYKYNVPESEVLDITEGVCLNVKVFEKYGVKEVKKVKRLTGPGAEASDVPGVTAGGGKWPGSYGLKEVRKQHRLSGPGLETAEEPGIMSGGGRWPGRYGLKEVNKVHRLSGPGLETADTPGMMQGGGKWPGRLMDMCEQYMGTVGEMEIYKAYKKNPKSRKQFEDFLCRGRGQLGECRKVEEAMKEHEDKESKKKSGGKDKTGGKKKKEKKENEEL